jgi:hypothetical protein
VEQLNLESAELIRIAIITVVLVISLGLLQVAFKLTKRILTMGCLGIVVLAAALTFLAMAR